MTCEVFTYTKQNAGTIKKKRSGFAVVRKDFLKNLAKQKDILYQRGFSEKDICRLEHGKVPEGWQVHHKFPLDDSGENVLDNLVLIQNRPYHMALTNYQNSFSMRMNPGESVDVEWPVPIGSIYPM